MAQNPGSSGFVNSPWRTALIVWSIGMTVVLGLATILCGAPLRVLRRDISRMIKNIRNRRWRASSYFGMYGDEPTVGIHIHAPFHLHYTSGRTPVLTRSRSYAQAIKATCTISNDNLTMTSETLEVPLPFGSLSVAFPQEFTPRVPVHSLPRGRYRVSWSVSVLRKPVRSHFQVDHEGVLVPNTLDRIKTHLEKTVRHLTDREDDLSDSILW